MLPGRGLRGLRRLGRPRSRTAALHWQGLVNSAWRNTCVEDWHAEGGMHDGDMMRVNSHMIWRVRQILHLWMTEVGLAADVAPVPPGQTCLDMGLAVSFALRRG